MSSYLSKHREEPDVFQKEETEESVRKCGIHTADIGTGCFGQRIMAQSARCPISVKTRYIRSSVVLKMVHTPSISVVMMIWKELSKCDICLLICEEEKDFTKRMVIIIPSLLYRNHEIPGKKQALHELSEHHMTDCGIQSLAKDKAFKDQLEEYY